MAVTFVDLPFPPAAVPPRWAGVLALACLYLLERYQNRLAVLGFDTYNVYLATHHWSRVRWRALRRAGRQCAACGRTRRETVLHVHHKRYHYGRERQKDLSVFCAYHHSIIHHASFAPQRPRYVEQTSFTGAAGPAARGGRGCRLSTYRLTLRDTRKPGAGPAPPSFQGRRREASTGKPARRHRSGWPNERSGLSARRVACMLRVTPNERSRS